MRRRAYFSFAMMAQTFLQVLFFLFCLSPISGSIYFLLPEGESRGGGLHLILVSLCPNSTRFWTHTECTGDQIYGNEYKFLA